MNSGLYVQNFWYIVNMVSRNMLESYVGYCNHGATLGVQKPGGRDETQVVLINWLFFKI